MKYICTNMQVAWTELATEIPLQSIAWFVTDNSVLNLGCSLHGTEMPHFSFAACHSTSPRYKKRPNRIRNSLLKFFSLLEDTGENFLTLKFNS